MRLSTYHVCRLVCWIALFSVQCPSSEARGPHHPCSEVDKGRRKALDQHLTHDNNHIQDDLANSNIVFDKPVNEMTEDEKSFYYFKLHDLDNNDALDGLELIHAATHHAHDHHQDSTSDTTADLVANADQEWAHVIDVIDDFIFHADENMDGYLNFVEYTSAVRRKEELQNASDDDIKLKDTNQIENSIVNEL